MHGGANEQAKQQRLRDIAEAQGRPQKHGIYARHIKDRETSEDYAAATVGSLDDEIRVVKALLAWAIRNQWGSKSGGLAETITTKSANKTTRAHKTVRVRSYLDTVGELADRVRRLELAREKLTEPGGTDEPMQEYREWVNLGKARSGSPKRARKSRPGSSSPSADSGSSSTEPAHSSQATKGSK